MRLRISMALLMLALLVPTLARATVITVDGGGGADYTTIQDAVDAAANLDTVLVYPGVYTDVHYEEVCYDSVYLNVHFAKNIVLRSADGPDATVIDGLGTTAYGVVALSDPDIGGTLPPQVVEGFTVMNGGPAPYFTSMGIVVAGGEARGNVVTGYGAGLSSDIVCNPTGIPDGLRQRSNATMIDNVCEFNEWGIVLGHGDEQECDATVSGNIVEGNTVGILVGEHFNFHNWTGTVDIADNTVRGNETGVRIAAPVYWEGWANVIGNEISGNTTGISVLSSGPSYYRGTIHVLMERNVVSNNTEIGVTFRAGTWHPSSPPGVDAVVGGSLEAANDFYGSPVNLRASVWGDCGNIGISGGYNFWGSVLCADFAPLFDVEEDDGVQFEFLPFTDESHSLIYEDCEASATQPVTWGRLKALYR